MDTITADKMPAQTETTAKPKRRSKIWKYLKYAAIGTALVLLIAHFAWKMSGSNEWELAKDEAGVKLWTLKTPGSSLVQVKSTVRVKSTMAGMLKLLEEMESCVDAQCYDAKIIERLPTPPGQYAAYVRFKFDVPGVHTQEYVLFQQRFQDPTTKQVKVDLLAAPAMLPRDECCVRITYLHNTWLLTPRDTGEIDIQFTQDTDTGGLPYPLANLGLIEGTFDVMKGMQDLMNKPRYRVDSFADIKELGQN
jgi:hypothetical protein